ncbi:hypothetical protein YPPY11_1821, partial [Yersinia pestis PY-11]
MKVILGYGFD